jgi:hypothetical protein
VINVVVGCHLLAIVSHKIILRQDFGMGYLE